MDKVITKIAFVIKLSKGDAVPLARESGTAGDRL
jgi:hypothetical protein